MLILWKNSYAIKNVVFFKYIFKKNVYFVASCVAQMRNLQALSCYPLLNVKVEFHPESSGSVQMYRKWFVFLQQSKISHFSFCNPHFSFSNLL